MQPQVMVSIMMTVLTMRINIHLRRSRQRARVHLSSRGASRGYWIPEARRTLQLPLMRIIQVPPVIRELSLRLGYRCLVGLLQNTYPLELLFQFRDSTVDLLLLLLVLHSGACSSSSSSSFCCCCCCCC